MIRRLTLAACALMISFTATAELFTGGKPLDPQPDPAALTQGLAVSYMFRYFDHINEVSALRNAKPGEKLDLLDHVSFEDGKVLTTNRPMGVGAQIRGMIHFEKTGVYRLRLQSNDGVKFHVGGIHLHTDPAIHAARWSPDLDYQVDEPGWYEFYLDYYQRKGTAALRLKWTPPGGEESIVPPEAYAH